MKEFINKIVYVQNALKAPKNQRNSFGGYNYRSCEDILEAVKPLLAKEGLVLTVCDDVVQIGERYYIKATAAITDGVNKIENVGFAREEENKKGMDASQITGSTSSYARKYALNGLLCIDDTKDADATNDHTDNRSRAEKAKETREINKANCEDLEKKAQEIISWLERQKELKAEDRVKVELLLKSLDGDKLIGYANKIAELLMNFDGINK